MGGFGSPPPCDPAPPTGLRCRIGCSASHGGARWGVRKSAVSACRPRPIILIGYRRGSLARREALPNEKDDANKMRWSKQSFESRGAYNCDYDSNICVMPIQVLMRDGPSGPATQRPTRSPEFHQHLAVANELSPWREGDPMPLGSRESHTPPPLDRSGIRCGSEGSAGKQSRP